MWFRNIFRRPNSQYRISNIEYRTGDTFNIELSPEVYRQLDRLRLRASRNLRSAGAGLRPSPRRRPAAEFLEHRPYVPGDDVRFVDWKASARSEHIYLKQGEQPQETTVHLLVDVSRSMSWGTPPKSRAALSLAAALGYLTLVNDDRLQLTPLSPSAEREQGGRGFKGKAQYPAFLNALRTISFAEQADLSQALREFTRRAPRAGMLLLLSDLLDAGDLPAALALFPRPAWEVTVFHLLHPDELDPPVSGELEIEEVETGRRANYNLTPQALAAYRQHLQTWRAGIELACIATKAFYTLIPTHWSLEKEAIPHLRKLRILESA